MKVQARSQLSEVSMFAGIVCASAHAFNTCVSVNISDPGCYLFRTSEFWCITSPEHEMQCRDSGLLTCTTSFMLKYGNKSMLGPKVSVVRGEQGAGMVCKHTRLSLRTCFVISDLLSAVMNSRCTCQHRGESRSNSKLESCTMVTPTVLLFGQTSLL